MLLLFFECSLIIINLFVFLTLAEVIKSFKPDFLNSVTSNAPQFAQVEYSVILNESSDAKIILVRITCKYVAKMTPEAA